MEKCNFTIIDKEYQEFVVELKLHINRQLYKNGTITEEMYIKAKKIIVDQASK